MDRKSENAFTKKTMYPFSAITNTQTDTSYLQTMSWSHLIDYLS